VHVVGDKYFLRGIEDYRGKDYHHEIFTDLLPHLKLPQSPLESPWLLGSETKKFLPNKIASSWYILSFLLAETPEVPGDAACLAMVSSKLHNLILTWATALYILDDIFFQWGVISI
jgi:hypothetical protein